jgi:hypothetical protein
MRHRELWLPDPTPEESAGLRAPALEVRRAVHPLNQRPRAFSRFVRRGRRNSTKSRRPSARATARRP